MAVIRVSRGLGDLGCAADSPMGEGPERTFVPPQVIEPDELDA